MTTDYRSETERRIDRLAFLIVVLIVTMVLAVVWYRAADVCHRRHGVLVRGFVGWPTCVQPAPPVHVPDMRTNVHPSAGDAQAIL